MMMFIYDGLLHADSSYYFSYAAMLFSPADAFDATAFVYRARYYYHFKISAAPPDTTLIRHVTVWCWYADAELTRRTPIQRCRHTLSGCQQEEQRLDSRHERYDEFDADVVEDTFTPIVDAAYLMRDAWVLRSPFRHTMRCWRGLRVWAPFFFAFDRLSRPPRRYIADGWCRRRWCCRHYV